MEIQIHHQQSGSKANQTEKFPLENFKEITFGRDDSSLVKWDPDRDDLVSRQHARIVWESGNPAIFTLTDLNSRNGTFVNKTRITGSTRIKHGDIVQFGAGGPEFIFKLEPPPNDLRPTRMAPPPTRTQAAPTRETPKLETTPLTSEVPPQQGRLTSLERRIVEEKNEFEGRIQEGKDTSRKHLINVAAGFLGVVVLVVGVLVYQDMGTKKQLAVTQQELAAAERTVEHTSGELKGMSGELEGIKKIMPPQQIAETFSKSTVYIESKWELIDKSGRKVYHFYHDDKPVYIIWKNQIEPVPTDDQNKGKPIYGKSLGSGFVISEQGFILTNRHISSPWEYLDLYSLQDGVRYNPEDGVIYNPKTGKYTNLDEEQKEMLKKWTGRNSAIFNDLEFFEKSSFDRSGKRVGAIEGRNISLGVTFPKTTLPYPARLVRESNEADVALLKIDVLDVPKGIPELDIESVVKPGNAVTVLGYPSISEETVALIQSKDPLNSGNIAVKVPDPTVTGGWVGKIVKMNPETKSQTKTSNEYFASMDSYQLTINATGQGNSGGPVFNDRGKVIGIFSYLRQKDGITISFAVPIEYGRKLRLNSSELQ